VTSDALERGVSMRGISKRFGAVQANSGLDLDFRPGEVHALLGENGAGKTTVMNILSGLLAPDEGEIFVDGERRRFGSPRDAMHAGIGMVHQNFRLVDRLTVAENLHFGWQETPRVGGGRKLVDRANELGKEFNVRIKANTPVWQLSVGERQQVAILRALSRGARVLILDEPTAVLTPQEADGLFQALRAMTARGTTVVFISHKLREVLEIAREVTILRGGRRVAAVKAADSDAASLARLMVGRDLAPVRRKPARAGGDAEPVVRLERVSALDDQGLPALRELSLEVRAGEILGIAGVAGNGQRELAHVVTGLRPVTGGRVLVGGEDMRKASVTDFVRAGVGYVPEDRMAMGCVPTAPVWRNAILKSYTRRPVARGPLLRRRPATELASKLVDAARLSTSDVDALVGNLSGGNVQRLIAARELHVASRLIVACYPSRGLDVGAIENVHAALGDACASGLGVLLISEELDELLAVADRIAVLYEGTIAGEMPAAEAEVEELGLLMGGAGRG
jgi:general nucleoside transport system ATP-binding protein